MEEAENRGFVPKDIPPKDRWAWVEIDKQALRRNVQALSDLLGPKTKMMAVVKADAYGHGAAECTKVMKIAGASMFGVATVKEGKDLRISGCESPIVVLSQPPETAIPDLIEYDLTPALFEFEFGLAYGEAAAAAGKSGTYHLVIDTGMNRTGVAPEDVLDLLRRLDFHRGLVLEGTFTQFATADLLNDWDFELQKKKFGETITEMRAAGFDPGIVHCGNTPATILHPEAHFDMVRVGIGMYGLHASPLTKKMLDSKGIHLEPVMSVRAKINRVTQPEVGEGVSYGLNYRIARPFIQIATVPLGYADGYHRIFSNQAEVLVAGKRHRQVGSICMDQCMFAVEVNQNRAYAPTNPVKVGKVVTLMGKDGFDEITAENLARMAGTINYEITCDFGMRLPKVYM